MKSKTHYINFQVGPVRVTRPERRHFQGIIVSLLNGIIENIDNPSEAKEFVNYFLRERLEVNERKVLKQLKLHIDSPELNESENEVSEVSFHSSKYKRLAKLFEEYDG